MWVDLFLLLPCSRDYSFFVFARCREDRGEEDGAQESTKREGKGGGGKHKFHPQPKSTNVRTNGNCHYSNLGPANCICIECLII